MEEKDTHSPILCELEELLKIHQDALADVERCRKFGARLAELLDHLEEMGETELADRVMDILSGCSPKIGSHCENAQRTKGMLERLIARMEEVTRMEEVKGQATAGR